MYSGEQVVSWPARELSQLKWMMLATLKSDVKTNDMSWTESNWMMDLASKTEYVVRTELKRPGDIGQTRAWW